MTLQLGCRDQPLRADNRADILQCDIEIVIDCNIIELAHVTHFLTRRSHSFSDGFAAILGAAIKALLQCFDGWAAR